MNGRPNPMGEQLIGITLTVIVLGVIMYVGVVIVGTEKEWVADCDRLGGDIIINESACKNHLIFLPRGTCYQCFINDSNKK